jgi:hypothetical protein
MAFLVFLLAVVLFLGLPVLALDHLSTLAKATSSTGPPGPNKDSERWFDWGPGYLGNLLAGLTREIVVQGVKAGWSW